jgi:hypothetical protein
MTRDPIGYLAGRNLYIYVHNDPVRLIDPLGLTYMDVNISIPLLYGIGVTFGGMIDTEHGEKGIYPYLGVGVMSSESFSVTFAPNQDPTPGLNIGVQAGIGGLAGQGGYTFGKEEGWSDNAFFGELGIGFPGLSLTGFWTFDPILGYLFQDDSQAGINTNRVPCYH